MFRQLCGELRDYAPAGRHMAFSALKAETGGSYLNGIWWVLEPLATTLVLCVLFYRLIGHSRPGYIAFVYSGVLIWSYVRRCSLYAIHAIGRNRGLVTRFSLPKPILICSNMLFNGIKMLPLAGVLIVLLFVQRTAVSLRLLFLFPLLMLMGLMIFGTGLILMQLGVFVDDLTRVYEIGMRLLFFLSGVFCDLRMLLPGPWGSVLVFVNPIAFLIHSVRDCLLYNGMPALPALAVWYVIALVLCALGLMLNRACEETIVRHI